ncbi:MAG: hypothetical protein F6J94_26790 [Moorea sp. SIO1F2]|uniref:hypothetical protein n=1 Tax=Moorena sp. SIO1F2 TaxID=2607819 RepID=UPI0013B63002|nr:hypothetical protein [Moorena sp. SIO1F2]NET85379.1 hypothetical protein [Moorena sp. SIO1F2]
MAKRPRYANNLQPTNFQPTNLQPTNFQPANLGQKATRARSTFNLLTLAKRPRVRVQP